MNLTWDRLGPLLAVPHLPTLGALHPAAIGPQVLRDVLDVAGTGRWLPHDKDQRWGGPKDEHIIDTTNDGGRILVATLARRNAGTIKVYLYGQAEPQAVAHAQAIAHHLAGIYQVQAVRVVWFLPPGQVPAETVAATRVQMRTFDSANPIIQAEPVIALDQLPTTVATTFVDFADAMAEHGFGFLRQHMRHARHGPVLTVVRDRRIVGAIGPMEILADPAGHARLLPQYFGVLPTYRGHGLGRALWRAAMHWGHTHHAAYQILSTVVNGASDHLCRSEELTELGLVCTIPVQLQQRT